VALVKELNDGGVSKEGRRPGDESAREVIRLAGRL